MLGGRGPAGGEADGRVVGVDAVPQVEGDMFGKGFQLAVFQDDELLVRGRVEEERAALLAQHLLEFHSHVDGVTADVEVQVVGKQRVELDAE